MARSAPRIGWTIPSFRSVSTFAWNVREVMIGDLNVEGAIVIRLTRLASFLIGVA